MRYNYPSLSYPEPLSEKTDNLNFVQRLKSTLIFSLPIVSLLNSLELLLPLICVKKPFIGHNQSLKSMLKKAVTSEGKDWDKMLLYLLFTYQEVPQASMGFSPFELLYGRAVNGPLDMLKNTWEAGGPGEDSVVSYILSIRDKLAKMTELVKRNLSNAQERQRKWYNHNAHTREFKPGQQVLV